MHDLLEGAIPYEMKVILQKLLGQEYLSIGTLNQRLKSFDFGYSELCDKPSEIDERSINPSNPIGGYLTHTRYGSKRHAR